MLPTQTGWAQSAARAPDTIEARVLACTSCHGPGGRGGSNASFPRLAGKPAGYLYNQLAAFRADRRHYPPMNYLLEFLPDAYLHAMADYFASQHPALPPPGTPIVSKDLLDLGKPWSPKAIPAAGSPPAPAVTTRI